MTINFRSFTMLLTFLLLTTVSAVSVFGNTRHTYDKSSLKPTALDSVKLKWEQKLAGTVCYTECYQADPCEAAPCPPPRQTCVTVCNETPDLPGCYPNCAAASAVPTPAKVEEAVTGTLLTDNDPTDYVPGSGGGPQCMHCEQVCGATTCETQCWYTVCARPAVKKRAKGDGEKLTNALPAPAPAPVLAPAVKSKSKSKPAPVLMAECGTWVMEMECGPAGMECWPVWRWYPCD